MLIQNVYHMWGWTVREPSLLVADKLTNKPTDTRLYYKYRLCLRTSCTFCVRRHFDQIETI